MSCTATMGFIVEDRFCLYQQRERWRFCT